jgi:hypothetical protein
VCREFVRVVRGEGWGEFNSHGVVLRNVTLRSRHCGRKAAGIPWTAV